jgi:hypothetical protein
MAGETLGTQFAAYLYDPSTLNASSTITHANFRPNTEHYPGDPTAKHSILQLSLYGFDGHKCGLRNRVTRTLKRA